MAKKKVTSETKEKQERTIELNSSIDEMWRIEKLLKKCINAEISPDCELLLLLIRGAIEKLDYFQDKYDFHIEPADHYYTEDLLKFSKKIAKSS